MLFYSCCFFLPIYQNALRHLMFYDKLPFSMLHLWDKCSYRITNFTTNNEFTSSLPQRNYLGIVVVSFSYIFARLNLQHINIYCWSCSVVVCFVLYILFRFFVLFCSVAVCFVLFSLFCCYLFVYLFALLCFVLLCFILVTHSLQPPLLF